MLRSVAVILLLALSNTVIGTELKQDHSPVIIYKTANDLESVKEDIELAIVDRGLIVSGTLHVSDMLNRTGEDLGYTKPVYKKAESIEFCSASLSHMMVYADPSNLVICPFTIGIYTLIDDPENVYVAFRRPQLAGAAAEATDAVYKMLNGIILDAIE